MKMTKQEFKVRWDSDDNGGGITFDDVADCAIAWGLCRSPRAMKVSRVCEMVLAAAGCDFPSEDEDSPTASELAE